MESTLLLEDYLKRLRLPMIARTYKKIGEDAVRWGSRLHISHCDWRDDGQLIGIVNEQAIAD